jgi:hypothetical protein
MKHSPSLSIPPPSDSPLSLPLLSLPLSPSLSLSLPLSQSLSPLSLSPSFLYLFIFLLKNISFYLFFRIWELGSADGKDTNANHETSRTQKNNFFQKPISKWG